MNVRLIRSIYLLRHGQTLPPAAEDPLGSGLSELGQRQAMLAAQRLSQYPIQRIYTSTLRRAAETAEIVGQHLPSIPLEPLDDLWECKPLVATPFNELLPHLDPKAVADDQERCDRLFKRFFAEQEGETTLLVCHGNLIRYLLCRVLNLPGEEWLRLDMNNCGICRVDWKSILGQQIVGFNDVGHLSPEMITYG